MGRVRYCVDTAEEEILAGGMVSKPTILLDSGKRLNEDPASGTRGPSPAPPRLGIHIPRPLRRSHSSLNRHL